jgi:hypothetical protein
MIFTRQYHDAKTEAKAGSVWQPSNGACAVGGGLVKPWIWLRVASAFLALFTAGHTFGHFASSEDTPEEKAVTDAMKNFHFDVMGSIRTPWDFLRGFSLLLIVNLAILTVVIWLLSNVARSSPGQARRLVWALMVGQSLISVICWTKFFLAPSVLSTLAALSLLVAAVGLQKTAGDLSK